MKKKIIAVITAVLILFCTFAVAASAAEKKSYVVLGDSIAFGSGLANPREAVYGKIVADTNGYDYANFAVPGHTTGNLMRRMEDETVRSAIRGADIISISIGGNNFLLGDLNGLLYDGIVKSDYTRMDQIAADFYADLETIIGTVRGLNPDAAILMQTLYNPQTSYVGEVYQQGANRLNAKVWEFDAANPGEILIVDVARRLTDSKKDFAEDRIHPSAAGNEKIALAVLETLKENGLGANTTPVIKTKGIDARGAGAFTGFVNLYGWIFHVIAVLRNLVSGLRFA